jgi:carbon storage regulator
MPVLDKRHIPGSKSTRGMRLLLHEERRLIMLVLRRRVGESIVIDGTITVSVLAVDGDRVKIGIETPPDILITRQELLTRPTEGQQGKSGSDPHP